MITGYILDPSIYADITFTVYIKDNCENIVITPPVNQIVTYSTSTTLQTVSGFVFTTNLGGCSALVYSLLNSNLSPYDTSIFTFNSAAPSFNIYTIDVSKVGTYTLALTGTVGIKYASCTITVLIVRGCHDSIISPDVIPDQTYNLYAAAITFSFN